MPLLLFLAFLLFPVLEIAVFIDVGGVIGTWPTVGAIFLTAVVGVSLVRAQGLATLSRARSSLQRNEFPLEEAFDGLCLAAAGLLLLTPGFVTDSLGGGLLVPPVRNALRRFVMSRSTFQMPPQGGPSRKPGGPTIDGHYHVMDDNDDENSPDGQDAPRKDCGNRLGPD